MRSGSFWEEKLILFAMSEQLNLNVSLCDKSLFMNEPSHFV